MKQNHNPDVGVRSNKTHSVLQYTLFLPAIDSGDCRQARVQLMEAQQAILDHAGGLTVYPVSVGYWVNPDGLICPDLIVPVTTVAPADLETVSFVTRLMADLAVYLNQQMIFWFAAPVWQFDAGKPHGPIELDETDLDRLMSESPLFSSQD